MGVDANSARLDPVASVLPGIWLLYPALVWAAPALPHLHAILQWD